MKLLVLVSLLIFLLLLIACGGMGTGGMGTTNVNASNSMNGNWTATMMSPNGAQMMVFTTALSQNAGNVVTATSFQFMTATACFAMGASGTGAFVPNASTSASSMGGSMTGSFGMTIQSGTVDMQSGSMGMEMGMTGNNMLVLQGSMANMNSVSGTWMMSGVTSGCSGSGNFTMTRM